ncbi:CocE/NonD family hydrolase [Streptomyces sp. TP-A0356]|uniref:CocE/NonD family hydrolase n=1 Tax=Streptomyces sp. TP-A0356 TaxID=1359208 RepID=UPI0006E310A6|nr:CocE/NonD family hydrolase [Streptomyces sp. TP-A0356]
MAATRTLIEHDVPVPMRDGTVLRADIWRPVPAGPHGGPAPDAQPRPAVLFRTPYDKSAMNLATLTPAQCVARGYAAVVQDTRGRHRSDGDWAPLAWEREGPDGHDTIEWIAAQPWCDGGVAMAGTSFQAIVQWLAAMEKPPHLRAIAPAMSTAARFDAEQLGGCLRLDHLTSWLGLMALDWAERQTAAGTPVSEGTTAAIVGLMNDPESCLRRRPPTDVLDIDGLPGWFRGVLSGRAAALVDYRLSAVDVPTFSVGGWYDVFSYGTIELHRAMRARDPRPGHHQLVMGPWVHSGQLPQVQGEVNTGLYGSAQAAGLADLHLDFFDRHLRPAHARGPRPGKEVRYFFLGPDTWCTAATWPPPQARTHTWQLAGAAAPGEGGRLVREPAVPRELGRDTFTYDPEDPVPTHGGRVLQLGRLVAGPLDQSHLEDRPDVLCYTSEALTEPVAAVGRHRLRLSFSSDAPATALVAKLTDVGPDGRSLIVAEGSRRLDLPEGRSAPVAVEVLLGDTAWRFAAGHRIRVHVTSSNFPHLDRHPNVAGAAGEARHSRTARQTVWHGGPHGSALDLQVLAPQEVTA